MRERELMSLSGGGGEEQREREKKGEEAHPAEWAQLFLNKLFAVVFKP